jgi:hypothetical protein
LAEEDSNHFEEWKSARDVLKTFDDNLHDLRKYGFTFITALITAQAILVPYNPADPTKGVPDVIKFAIFGVTLLLVAALHLIDRNYTLFQEAAASRAKILERALNLELTEIISQRYASGKVAKSVFLVYLLFTLGITIFGAFVLYSSILLVVSLEVLAVAVIVSTYFYGPRFMYVSSEDWTLSPIECESGEKVRITLTNLNRKWVKMGAGFVHPTTGREGEIRGRVSVPKPIVFKKDQLVWVITKEDGQYVRIFEAPEILRVFDSHTWFWDTGETGVGTGIFEVRPREWPLPLHKRIVVRERSRADR